MTRFLPFNGLLLLAAALILSLSACDSGGSNEEEPDVEEGRVEISINGDASGTFDGYAYFFDVVDDSTGESAFGLILNNTNSANQSGQYIWIARESSRPGTGQYDFAAIDEENSDLRPDQFIAVALSVVNDDSAMGSIYFSNGGTLTLTSSSDDKVAGSFIIEAVSFRYNSESEELEEVDITLEGAFDANPTNSYFNPDF